MRFEGSSSPFMEELSFLSFFSFAFQFELLLLIVVVLFFT